MRVGRFTPRPPWYVFGKHTELQTPFLLQSGKNPAMINQNHLILLPFGKKGDTEEEIILAGIALYLRI